jgi:hypothetical protein
VRRHVVAGATHVVAGATERRREYLGGIVATVLCRLGVPRTRAKIASSRANVLLARFDPTCESPVVIRKKAAFGERRGRVRRLHTKIFSLPKFTTQSPRGARSGAISDSRSDHASRKRVLRESRK